MRLRRRLLELLRDRCCRHCRSGHRGESTLVVCETVVVEPVVFFGCGLLDGLGGHGGNHGGSDNLLGIGILLRGIAVDKKNDKLLLLGKRQ